MKGLKMLAAGAALGAVLLGGGACYFSRTETFMQEMGSAAGTLAAASLGTEVEVGSIEVSSLHELTIRDIKIYDKQAETMLQAREAQVGFRLLAVLEAPAETVKTVTLKGVEANLSEREDGSWNVEDLMSSQESSTKFQGRVEVEEATVRLKSYRLPEAVELEQVAGTLDCAAYPTMKVEGTAKNQGANLSFQGTLGSDRQIVSLKAENAEIGNYLQLLPEGLLPQELELQGGKLEEALATVVYQQGLVSLTGSASLKEGRLKALGTEIEKVEGKAAFTDSQVLFDAKAQAAGQQARAHGKVTLLEGTPYLDVEAESEAFDPSLVMTNIPYRGPASFTARFTGTIPSPAVEVKAKVPEGEAYGIPFTGAEARIRYEGGRIYAQEMKAGVFGGSVQGELEIDTEDLSFTGHAKAQNLDVAQAGEALAEFADLGDISGRASGDVGFAGVGQDIAKASAYGSLRLERGSCRGLSIERAGTSFVLADDSLTIDTFSARLPRHGDVGLEGKVENLHASPLLQLSLYGGHVELGLFKALLPQADMSGFADFKGTLSGTAANPDLKLDFSATRGQLFRQPYDSVRFHAEGSLDRVVLEDFSLMKNGKQTWYVDGFVGLAGERKIDLRADTVGVRMEDLAALVAPDQPITGNVDNTIRFTGTLDNPQAVGYIHFYLGSYMGVLLSGMDGDYYLENGVIRLQDFHIYSPMVDMDVNGTVDRAGKLELLAKVHDIDMKRIQHKLPYEVSGHGTFEGNIRGSVASPVFHGILDAPSLILNGQELRQLHGRVDYAEHKLRLSEFGFAQGESGYCGLEASLDTQDETLQGNALVQEFDIEALCDLLNQHNDKLTGKISLGAQLGGTLREPDLLMEGSILRGQAAGYDIDEVKIKGHLQEQVLHLEELSGRQGEGSFTGSGTVDLGHEGGINATLSAQDLSLGMFTSLAGFQTEVEGRADIKATFGGYLQNPAAEVEIDARNGGVAGSTFDTMSADLKLKNGLLDVQHIEVQKLVGEKKYQASARGIVPSTALRVENPEDLNDFEQIRLEISLDDADLSLLPALYKQVDWAMGPMDGSLLITGTAAHPQFNGAVRVEGGSVKLKGLQVPITEMGLRLDFNGTQMTVKDFSGRMGQGSYQGSGKLQLEGLQPVHYGFDLIAQQLEVQSEFFKGPLDGEVHLSEGKFFDRVMPKVSGQVELHDCLISMPTIPDSEGELPDIILDFDLKVGQKVHFYSAYLYDMYLKGGAHFGGTTRHPKTSGQVEVAKGGTVSYLKMPFKIRQGAAYFNQVDSFLPSLDFQADTTVGRTRIFLNLNGPLGDMKFRLSSAPELSQTEILQVLTLGRDYAAGEGSITAGDMLSLGLQLTVLAEMESAVRSLLFLDHFSVHRGGPMSDFVSTTSESNSREDEYSIEIGKYITPKLMVKYSQGIGSAHKSRYGLEYSFNDRLGLVVEREGSETVVGFTGRVRF